MTTAAAEELTRQITIKNTLVPAGHYLTHPIRQIREYDREDLRPDVFAGITIAVILLPQAIAFSLIAELPPQMGLYAAVIGGLAGALWGSSDQMHTGPANAISLLVFSSLAGIAVVGSSEYIVAATMLALLVGLFQLLLGLARLGVLVNFVSHSVIVGFATGAAALIAVRQIKPLLGLQYPSDSVLTVLTGAATHISEIDPPTAAIGIGTIIFLVVMQRISDKIPAALLAMILSSLIVYALGDSARDVEVVGLIPAGLPPLSMPVLNWDLISSLSSGVLAIGAIGLVESMAIGKSLAAQTRQRLDSNQEFVGQGMANLLTGLFSGYPVAGSFSRSAVNLRAGARSPFAAVFSAIFVLLAMQFLGPFAAYLPMSALAGVLMVTAYRMIDQEEIKRILRGGRGDAVIMVVTLLGTLFLQLETAVLLGIGLSFARYLMRTSTPQIRSVVPDENYRHFLYSPDKPECPQLGIVEILGDLYFGAVNHVEDFVLDHSAKYPEQIFLLLRMGSVNNMDFSGIYMLENIVRYYRERGGDVFLVGVNPGVWQRMEDTDFVDYIGPDNFLDEDSAISELFYHVLNPAACIYECPVRVFKECQNLPKRLDLIDVEFEVSPTTQDVHWIDARPLWDELHLRRPDEKPVIVDVREPREYRQGHIVDAVSVPLTTFKEGDPGLPRDRELVVVCRTSRRSRLAAGALKKLGYENITILTGGMNSWEAEKLLEAVETFPAVGGSK
ncbi:MAG: SulP family inorganic anion transporter [Candidatus Promineifilaceae bacterium]